MMTINLVPAAARERARVRRRLHRWATFIAVYTLALAGGCLALRMSGGEEQTRLASDGSKLAERVNAADRELSQVRQQVQDHARRLEASETVGVHPDWSILLACLSQLRDEGVVLQSVDIRSAEAKHSGSGKPKGVPKPEEASADKASAANTRARPADSYLVQLKGFGLSHGEVVQFVRRLEELGPLRDVRLKEARTQPYRGVAAVSFDAEFRMLERVPLVLPSAVAGVEAKP